MGSGNGALKIYWSQAQISSDHLTSKESTDMEHVESIRLRKDFIFKYISIQI